MAVWPTGDPLPAAGSLNLNPGITQSNATFTKIGAGGGVSFYNGGTTPLDLAANLQGWLPNAVGLRADHLATAFPRHARVGFDDHRWAACIVGAGAIQLNGTIDVPTAGRGLIPAKVASVRSCSTSSR